MNKPLLLGHRGARDYAPENTIRAFDLTLAHGCDGFEFDVRRSADGRAVVVHDPTLKNLVVEESTVKQLRSAYPELPTLEDIFERFASTAFLNAELKVAGLEAEVSELVRRFPPKRGILVSSFLPEVVLAVHDVVREVPLGFICRDSSLVSQWRVLPITDAVFHHKILNPVLLQELNAAGKSLIVWTLNSKNQMLSFARQGASGIISDDTRLLSGVLGIEIGIPASAT
jgi:glycerophosphoryl diester phosphodiesterase